MRRTGRSTFFIAVAAAAVFLAGTAAFAASWPGATPAPTDLPRVVTDRRLLAAAQPAPAAAPDTAAPGPTAPAPSADAPHAPASRPSAPAASPSHGDDEDREVVEPEVHESDDRPAREPEHKKSSDEESKSH